MEKFTPNFNIQGIEIVAKEFCNNIQKVEFLNKNQDETYHICAKNDFYLRVSNNPITQLESEINLIHTLKDNGILTLEPICDLSGQAILEITKGEDKYCVVAYRLPRICQKTQQSQENMQKVGETLAKIHKYSQNCNIEKLWYENKILANGSKILANTMPELEQYYVDFLAKMREKTIKLTHKNSEKTINFGVINGNFTSKNYGFFNKKVLLTSFGYCERGFLLYDIATCVYSRILFNDELPSNILRNPNVNNKAKRVLDEICNGYSKILALPPLIDLEDMLTLYDYRIMLEALNSNNDSLWNRDFIAITQERILMEERHYL